MFGHYVCIRPEITVATKRLVKETVNDADAMAGSRTFSSSNSETRTSVDRAMLDPGFVGGTWAVASFTCTHSVWGQRTPNFGVQPD